MYDENEDQQCFNTEQQFKKIIRQILHSVKVMHEIGIVHRDLKLENIMITKLDNRDEIRIIDFGLSTSVTKQKLTSFVGTPHYMAPEIIKGSYDEKCDVWSLGVITYLLFSQGQFPFEADGEIKIYKAIRKGKFYLPEDGNCENWIPMSDEAKDFIKCLLNSNPAKRPSAY